MSAAIPIGTLRPVTMVNSARVCSFQVILAALCRGVTAMSAAMATSTLQTVTMLSILNAERTVFHVHEFCQEFAAEVTLAALCRGVTAMRAMIVEQLGLAMIPPCPYRIPFIASGLTSGMTRGTPSVILNAELLSTTCHWPNQIINSAFEKMQVVVGV